MSSETGSDILSSGPNVGTGILSKVKLEKVYNTTARANKLTFTEILKMRIV